MVYAVFIAGVALAHRILHRIATAKTTARLEKNGLEFMTVLLQFGYIIISIL